MRPVGILFFFALILAGLCELFGFKSRNDLRGNRTNGASDFKRLHSTASSRE